MKLRNKKTGEIGQIGYIATHDGQIIVEDISGDEYPYSVICGYGTLAELNEEWEDYKPAEPLIKDEKIRKAAIVEAYQKGYHEGFADACDTITPALTEATIDIAAKLKEAAQESKAEAIAELCGEADK